MRSLHIAYEEVAVEFVQRVRKTDLARNTRRVINAVHRGQTALIESHGEAEAAIIDIIDYRILRAVVRYHARQVAEQGKWLDRVLEVQQGLSEQEVAALPDPQAQYDLALAHYLAGGISLARTAELLGQSWLELRTRFLRLDVPVRAGPAEPTEAKEDMETAAAWRREQRE